MGGKSDSKTSDKDIAIFKQLPEINKGEIEVVGVDNYGGCLEKDSYTKIIDI